MSSTEACGRPELEAASWFCEAVLAGRLAGGHETPAAYNTPTCLASRDLVLPYTAL